MDHDDSDDQVHYNNRHDTSVDKHANLMKREDLERLLDRMQAETLKKDRMRAAARLNNFPWQTVSFDNFTAEDCKQAYVRYRRQIHSKMTISDELWMGRNLLKSKVNLASILGGSRNSSSGLKRPLTGYLRFQMAKRRHYQAKNPGMSNTEFMKFLAQKWAKLSERKRRKYQEAYEQEKVEYNEKMQQLMGENGDGQGTSNHQGESGEELPEKRTAFDLYCDAKFDEIKAKYPDRDAQDLIDKLQRKFDRLSEEKKERWTQQAVDENERILREFRASTPARKRARSMTPGPGSSAHGGKSKAKIKEADLQKYLPNGFTLPEKPKSNAYFQYLHENYNHPDFADLPTGFKQGNVRSNAVAARWKTLPAIDKINFKEQFEKKQKVYKEKVEKLLKKIEDPEGRARVEEALM